MKIEDFFCEDCALHLGSNATRGIHFVESFLKLDSLRKM